MAMVRMNYYLYFYNAPDGIESHMENLRLIHYYNVLRGISVFGLESRG